MLAYTIWNGNAMILNMPESGEIFPDWANIPR